MRVPHVLTLAQIDEVRFISACRSGVIHLTWVRATVRLDREEFRRLAWLLERAADIQPPTSLRDGDLSVTHRQGGECEFRVGTIVLLLSSDDFQRLAEAAQEALLRLDEILTSGVWDRMEDEDGPPDVLNGTGRVPFSKN
jgi:hypothetical protein